MNDGACRWVQVRDGAGEGKAAGKPSKRGPGSEAGAPSGIGFHWDKDEDLLDSTGVCICPQISTVTYLTVGSPALPLYSSVASWHLIDRGAYFPQSGGAPTMVLGKKPQLEYDDDEGMYCSDITEAWISHPEAAKHIAFSGNLLHGAPREMARENARRVTFLVNIWLNYCPVGLKPLPKQHISRLSQFQSVKAVLDLPTPSGNVDKAPVG